MKFVLLNLKKAKAYADKYCSGGNDCADGQLTPPAISDDFPFIALHNTDCCHFVAHVLNAGGVKIPGKTKSCVSELVIRGKDLVPWLDNAVATTSNVKKLKTWQEARQYDIAIQTENDAGTVIPRHIMWISGDVKATGARVYGHTNNRCGDEFVDFDSTSAWFYRIEVPWDGQWITNDAAKRFRLDISGSDVNWIEQKKDGSEISRSVSMQEVDGTYVIRRPNDDAVLRFLDFPDATLRQAIINAGAKPSYMELKLENNKIQAKWYGLRVKKKADGTLDSLVQPGTAAPSDFVLSR